MTDTLIAQLRELANAATPGPWKLKDRKVVNQRDNAVCGAPVYVLGGYAQSNANAVYIAAASPDVVLGLVDRIEALQAEVEMWKATANAVVDFEKVELRAEVEQITAFKDGAYLERNKLVALLSKVFPSGKKKTAIEGWSEDWHGCVYIDLPTGQASWHYHDSQSDLFAHLPEYQGTWDGHTTDEKYERISQFAAEARLTALEGQEPVAWKYQEATHPEGDLRGRGWRFHQFSMSKPNRPWMQDDVIPLYLAAGAAPTKEQT